MKVARPRVRDRAGKEVSLESWQALRDGNLLLEWALNLMGLNVSTRKYLSLPFIPSDIRSDGRDLFRFRTAPCWRRARSSVWDAARPTKSLRKTAGGGSMILCLSERVSEGDAKFQGFCRRWNKWEGQGALDAFSIATNA